jgi:rSAM/selenodomain-associated transferase 2
VPAALSMHRGLRIVAIVPALDEERSIGACLEPLTGEGADVVVVDGGSTDATVRIAREAGASVTDAPRGRASQMNAGAARAGDADVLLFVHADTRLPRGWRRAIENAVNDGARWGRFDVALDSPRAALRVVATMMNLRSRLTGICTGDQALFVRADAWRRTGGYAPIRLMEDIELSRRYKRSEGRPAALRLRVLVSARRWERTGVLRTTVLMWCLRALYFFGASPETIHRLYYGERA